MQEAEVEMAGRLKESHWPAAVITASADRSISSATTAGIMSRRSESLEAGRHHSK
jgi:hypothetical protein